MAPSGPDPRRPRIAVAGAHLSGQPLNDELLTAGGRLAEDTTTAPYYRLLALAVDPPKPALVRARSGGAAIAVEVWELSPTGLGNFLADLAPPMAIARIELADSTTVIGFTCEADATEGAVDITGYGGWRAYRVAVADGTGAISAPPGRASEPSAVALPDWYADLHSELADRLGLQVLQLTAERVVGRMPVAGNTQPFGLWHGGASCLLAETLASLGSLAHGRPQRRAVGVDINATHHRSAVSGWVIGVATAVHLGRTVTSYEVVLRDEDGRRLCTARVSCQMLEYGAAKAR